MSIIRKIKNIFTKTIAADVITLYSYPGVMEVIPANRLNHDKPMKCLNCHRRPCICAAKGDNRVLIWEER